MSTGAIHVAGSAPRLADVTVVTLYEPSSGEIVHVHTVIRLQGGREVSQDEAIEAARRRAESLGHRVAELEVKVSTRHEHAARPHRIDLETREFVAIAPRQLRKRERPEAKA